MEILVEAPKRAVAVGYVVAACIVMDSRGILAASIAA